MTPVERLRAAEMLLRDGAGRVPEWNMDSGHLWVVDYDPSDPTGQTAMQRPVGGADEPWASFIAMMAPPVALAMADWLGDIALFWENSSDAVDDDGDPIDLAGSIDSHAVKLADALLGGDGA